MRSLGALSSVAAFALLLAISTGDGSLALAQSVDDTTEDAATAEKRADAASGLVDEAVAARSDIEFQLADTIARINDLAAQLSKVSASLDKLESQIGFADAELVGIADDLEHQAVDAYMTALAAPGVSIVNTENVEKALVAGLVVEDVVTAGKEKVDQLQIKKRLLEELQIEHQAQQEEVAGLKEQVDAEMEKLELLYEEADVAVAEAIREANAADAAYRDALSAVDAAQARQAENQRQEERDTTPPTTSQTTTSTTTSPSTGSTSGPTSTVAPSTTSTTSGGGGWTFPPVVEQWRGLVQQHFPATRVDEALRIMQCESRGDPDAYNPYSGASGLFQFLPSTWATTAPKAGYGGASVFDPVANTAAAAWLANRYQELGQYYWQAWSCRRFLN